MKCNDVEIAKSVVKYLSISSLILITIECSANEDCTGSSDTCKNNVCYCGSGDEKCLNGYGICTDAICQGKYQSISQDFILLKLI